MNVLIEDDALRDLHDLHAFMTQHDPAVASAMVTSIFDQIEHIGAFPYLGHRGRIRSTFEWVDRSSWRVVVYRLDRDRDVHVIGVFQGSRQTGRP